MADSGNASSTPTVLILLFCLLGLLVLLVFLYKMLNREANGQYTIRRMVYKEGGVRDRVRGLVSILGTRLGVRLWPGSDTDEDGEEMQEIQDEEGQVEEGGSQGSDSEGYNEDEEDDVELRSETKKEGSDSSDDNSSLESSEAGEQTQLTDQTEANVEMGEKGGEKVRDGEGKEEASGGTGLLVDLKQFSGSAIWSEERGDESIDVTPL